MRTLQQILCIRSTGTTMNNIYVVQQQRVKGTMMTSKVNPIKILNAQGRYYLRFLHSCPELFSIRSSCYDTSSMMPISLLRNPHGISRELQIPRLLYGNDRTTTTVGTTGSCWSGILGHVQQQKQQRQQYRTKLTLIDFDQYETQLKEEKAKSMMDEEVVVVKKKKHYETKEKKRERMEAEERVKYTFRYDKWEDAIRNLLNLETYPVGFTNTNDNHHMIASWCQQISHTLQQTLSVNAAISLELVLQLLDRLFQEQEAHIPGSSGVQVLMSSDISSSAIESFLKSWKFSLLYPPFYETMTVEQVRKAQERVEYYGKFLAKHDDSMLAQISELLDVDRIVHTKTKSTERQLWGHIPYTVHPNSTESKAKLYWGYVDANGEETEIDIGGDTSNNSDDLMEDE
jgi:ribosomal protein S21